MSAVEWVEEWVKQDFIEVEDGVIEKGDTFVFVDWGHTNATREARFQYAWVHADDPDVVEEVHCFELGKILLVDLGNGNKFMAQDGRSRAILPSMCGYKEPEVVKPVKRSSKPKAKT